jgi:hypothetical protein
MPSITLEHTFCYVECDVPAGMTLSLLAGGEDPCRGPSPPVGAAAPARSLIG